jgi:hypothetical protein
LHWQLDISLGEDQSRTRKGHGTENYSRVCRIALNLLKRDTSLKVGIKANASMPAGTTITYCDSSASEDAMALERGQEVAQAGGNRCSSHLSPDRTGAALYHLCAPRRSNK